MSLKCKFGLANHERRKIAAAAKAFGKSLPARSGLKQWFDFFEISDDRAKVLDHGRGGFLVPLAHKQIEYAQVFATLAVIALTIDHRAIGQETANAVHPPQGIEKERIARGRRQHLMEAHATFVQRI